MLNMSTNTLNQAGINGEIMTLAEAAEYLKITPRQVIRYKVPHFDLGQKTKLFSREDILIWLETKRRGE